ncbi:MAG: hypothetical protein Q7J48_00445 [Nocardioides sp.]|nr:hypothetical protein [Nocardioides sp.]
MTIAPANYCSVCGRSVRGANFCPGCGGRQAPTAAGPIPPRPAAPPKVRRNPWKLLSILCVGALLNAFILGMVAGYLRYYNYGDISPARSAGAWLVTAEAQLYFWIAALSLLGALVLGPTIYILNDPNRRRH